MSYVDEIAKEIAEECGNVFDAEDSYTLLWRLYALLALSLGESVANENVHDAWSVWMLDSMPDHRSLVPFLELSRNVQDLDIPYRDAIRRVAARRV